VADTTNAAGTGGSRRGGHHRGGQYVELEREATDRIFVVLTEFGNERHPDYPDQDTDPDTPGPARFDGPLHNEIPEPDRSVDNSTVWQPDYSHEHYQDLYFGGNREHDSVRTYYEKQSSGRYSVSGTVTDWVRVRYNEARYGRSNGFPVPTSCATTCGISSATA
jgi:immune inhibitor A